MLLRSLFAPPQFGDILEKVQNKGAVERVQSSNSSLSSLAVRAGEVGMLLRSLLPLDSRYISSPVGKVRVSGLKETSGEVGVLLRSLLSFDSRQVSPYDPRYSPTVGS